MNSRLRHSPLFWAVAATAGRHAVGAWQMRRTLAYLQAGHVDPDPAGGGGARPLVLHMIMPVLWEQNHVGAALRWFAALLSEMPGSTLTVVSTSREERERTVLLDQLVDQPTRPVTAARFPQLGDATIKQLHAARQAGALTRSVAAAALDTMPSTREVIVGLLASGAFDATAIRHVHYDGFGRKAAQVNEAVTRLTRVVDHDFIAVYDVDSRPEPALLRRTAAFIEHRRTVDGEWPHVVQQSARFVTSGTADRGWQRAVCRGGARLQTLWTLRREIPSFRRYARTARSSRPVLGVLRRGLAQTVGHGLLVRRDVFRAVGGLPEFTTLDDLPFGFQLTVQNIPVDVVTAVSTAPAPEHPRELVEQQRRWFANYQEYPACAAAARTDGRGSPASRVGALAVAGYRGMAWALATPATVMCTAALLAPRTPAPVRAAAGAALWLGCVTPIQALAAYDARADADWGAQPRPRPVSVIADVAEVYAAYLLRSVGPLTALAGMARRSGPAALSPKTHRRTNPEEHR